MDELQSQFLLEGRELAQQAAGGLLSLERRPDDLVLIGGIFRAVHTIKGGAGLFDLRPMGSLLHAAEDVLDALRKQVLRADKAVVGALIGTIVQVERWLDDFEAASHLPPDAAEKGRALETALSAASGEHVPASKAAVPPIAEPDWARALAATLEDTGGTLTAIRYTPPAGCFFTGDDPLQIVRAVPGLKRLDIVPREPWSPADSFDPFACNVVILAVSDAPRADVATAFRFVPDQVELVEIEGRGAEADAAGQADRMLRVPAARLDQLAEIADELIVARSELAHALQQIAGTRIDPRLARGIASGQAAMDRLVARLHRTVADLRLVPLSPLLRRFPILAREIADGLGKQVELIVRGDVLEVDKSIVDGLFEPLLHLVRNAVDHGVESGDARRAAGKPAVATITLDAHRLADSFVIALADDGKGIDVAALRRAARERLGLDEAALVAMDEQETLDLIFRPGFSTSATVNELSGRGVGMDAVRSAVTALGGRVGVASTAGTGTTVSITLPFRIAVTRVVTVGAGEERFGVPIDSIVETVRVSPEQIQSVRHGRAFIWREKVLPLFDLPQLLGRTGNISDINGLYVLIVGAGDRLAGIAVDKLSDRIDVLMRPLEGFLAGIKGLSGTALTGDGNVLLILNPIELVA